MPMSGNERTQTRQVRHRPPSVNVYCSETFRRALRRRKRCVNSYREGHMDDPVVREVWQLKYMAVYI